MTRYKKGTVVLVLFPNSGLATAKRRPALIVQADEPATDIEQVIAALITSNLSREGHPSRIRINKESHEGKLAGLLTDSVIMTDNLATIRLVEIDKAIGALSDMTAVDEALMVTFGLTNA
ncbi:MAG: type II toxin-antitoxin system PemK/MazF family toxin [Nitrospinae bacterium]|nr:type II toxin-antitoxin system PemK/MazF family toxin [Nitrospinota bacterium]